MLILRRTESGKFAGFYDSYVVDANNVSDAISDIKDGNFADVYIADYGNYDTVFKYPGSLNDCVYGVVIVYDGDPVPDSVKDRKTPIYRNMGVSYYNAPHTIVRGDDAVKLLKDSFHSVA